MLLTAERNHREYGNFVITAYRISHFSPCSELIDEAESPVQTRQSVQGFFMRKPVQWKLAARAAHRTPNAASLCESAYCMKGSYYD